MDDAQLAEMDSETSAFEAAWPGDPAAAVLAGGVRADIDQARQAPTPGEFWNRAGAADRFLASIAR